MKIRFIKIFVLTFVIIFVFLNGRYIYANIKYWLTIGPLPTAVRTDVSDYLPPPHNSTASLPNQATLKIPSLGISAPIVFGVDDNLKNIYDGLEKGTVHYSVTPKPGMEGVSIILGHSSAYPWYKGAYGSVFALLGRLKTGDTFSIEYSGGPSLKFSVKQSLIFSPFSSDTRLIEIEKTPGSSVVLISCWPIGTNYKRIAIQAELI